MNIIVDTNILVRFFIQDDELQFQKVSDIFQKAKKIIVPTNTLCELVWVLSYSYQLKKKDIIKIMNFLLDTDNVVVKADEINFGLKMLANNGDFSDGINAFLGMEMAFNHQVEFISFDKKAVKILQKLGVKAREL